MDSVCQHAVVRVPRVGAVKGGGSVCGIRQVCRCGGVWWAGKGVGGMARVRSVCVWGAVCCAVVVARVRVRARGGENARGGRTKEPAWQKESHGAGVLQRCGYGRGAEGVAL